MIVLSSAQTLAEEKVSPYVIFSIHMGPEAFGTEGGEMVGFPEGGSSERACRISRRRLHRLLMPIADQALQ